MKLAGLHLAITFTLLLASSADARSYPVHHNHHHRLHSSAIASGFYTNVDGHRVHRPARAASRPSGATAQCGDGSWSFSQNHGGTCSHHGGVSSWL